MVVRNFDLSNNQDFWLLKIVDFLNNQNFLLLDIVKFITTTTYGR